MNTARAALLAPAYDDATSQSEWLRRFDPAVGHTGLRALAVEHARVGAQAPRFGAAGAMSPFTPFVVVPVDVLSQQRDCPGPTATDRSGCQTRRVESATFHIVSLDRRIPSR